MDELCLCGPNVQCNHNCKMFTPFNFNQVRSEAVTVLEYSMGTCPCQLLVQFPRYCKIGSEAMHTTHPQMLVCQYTIILSTAAPPSSSPGQT